MEIKDLISKYRKRRLGMQKERREYVCDHGHNWMINLCKDIEKDLKKLNSEKEGKTCATKHDIPPKPKDLGILSNFT